MTTNPNFKPSEGKREEFRKYLEKNGIMDALTKVLVNLYEEVEKPEDALQYLLDKLAAQAGLETHKTLLAKLEETQEQMRQLETELESLKLAAGGGRPSAGEAPPKGGSTVSQTKAAAENEGAAAETTEPTEEAPEEPTVVEPVD